MTMSRPSRSRLPIVRAIVALLLLSPAVSLAQENLILINPAGLLRVRVTIGDSETVVSIPVTGARVEFQEGPSTTSGAKRFILTHLRAQFAEIVIRSRQLGEQPMRIVQLGMHLAEAVEWNGKELQPGVPGRYRIDVTGASAWGEPVFTLGFKIAESFPLDEDDGRMFTIDSLPLGPVTGTIDLGARTATMKADFFAFNDSFLGLSDVHWDIELTLSGPIVRRGSGGVILPLPTTGLTPAPAPVLVSVP